MHGRKRSAYEVLRTWDNRLLTLEHSACLHRSARPAPPRRRVLSKKISSLKWSLITDYTLIITQVFSTKSTNSYWSPALLKALSLVSAPLTQRSINADSEMAAEGRN